MQYTLPLSLRPRITHPPARTPTGLLSPCFKTSRTKSRSRSSSTASARLASAPAQQFFAEPRKLLRRRRPAHVTSATSHSDPTASTMRAAQCGHCTCTRNNRLHRLGNCCAVGCTPLRLPRTVATRTPLTQHNPAQHQSSFASLSAIAGAINSLSKVLFIVPLRYFCVIALQQLLLFRYPLLPS